MENPKIEACLKVLGSAKSDNEKFAALLMVAKLTKAKHLTSEERKELLSAIGMKFLIRLLKSKSAPEGCPVSMYQSIALSILSGLCTDPHLVARVGLKKNIAILNGILLSNPGGDETQKCMVDDSYDILQNLATTEEGTDQLLDNHTPVTLCRVILDNIYGADRAECVMKAVLSVAGDRVWIGQSSLLHSFLAHYVQLFKRYQDDNKFQLCSFLQQILQTIPDSMVEECAKKTWLPICVDTLKQILTSKLSENQRNPTLCLVSALIDRLNVTCVLPPLTPNSQLLLVVTHLSCIEIRMILENFTFEQIVERADVLCSCYLLMENIINYMTTSPSLMLDEKQILQLHSAMIGSVNAILCFLKEISEKDMPQIPEPVVIATVRVLGVWMSEETSALKASTYEILPFLLKICKLQVNSRWKYKNRGHEFDKCQKNTTNATEHNHFDEAVGTKDKSYNYETKHSCDQSGQSDAPSDKSESQAYSESIFTSESTSVVDSEEQAISTVMEQCTVDSPDESVVQDSKNISYNDEKNKENTDSDKNFVTTDITELDKNNKSQNLNNSSTCIKNFSPEKHKSVSFNVEDSSLSGVDSGDNDRDNIDCVQIWDSNDTWCDVDVIRFMLPAFCHFMAEDTPRQILLANHTQTWLVDYFKLCLATVMEEGECKSAKGSLEVLCGALLNLVVLERDLINTDDDMLRLCSFVVEAAPVLLNQEDHLILWSNLITLGSFLLLRQYNTSKVPTDQKSKFFLAAMSFVKGPYVTKPHGQSDLLEVSEVYAPVWEDVSQLWHFGLQALCECIPLYPVLCHSLLSAGVLPYWSKLLGKVKGRGVTDEVRDGILTLITIAVKTSPKVKDVAKTTECDKIAKMYKWTELQFLLGS